MHLVGSGLVLAECMRLLVRRGLMTEDEAWRAGLANPLAILGLSEESLADTGGLPPFRF
jgi:imidazolonepropionase-like amidohydrolase